jgi:hypothetical protein
MSNEHRKGPRELCTGGEWIYGRNPAVEVMRAARRTVREVVLPPFDKNEADEIAWLRQTAHQRHIVVRTEDRKRLDVIPGITCLWQIGGRSDIPFKEQVRLDKDYILAQGFWKDLAILLKTVPAIIGGKGAY